MAQALELGGAADVRVRNLLGLVHFRAGRLAEARDIYQDLVAGDPEDPGLRLNLGLVELRLGRYREAVAHLALVTEKEPRNQRARGYLGLALLRSGDLAGARRAFLEAGQGDLARQVEDRIPPGMVEALEGSALAVRHIAEDGLRAVEEQELPFASVETERRGVSEGPAAGAATDSGWQVRRSGEVAPEVAPPAPAAPAPPPHPIELLRVDLPVPMTEFATQRLVPRGLYGEPFGLTERGMLIIRVDGQLSSRATGAVLSTGQMTFEPLYRRERGRFTEDLFGGEADGLSRVSGKGLILVAPQGQRFTALSLQNDILYLREPSVYAFEDSLHWENGRVPGGAGWYPLVQFRGSGR
ncbi:MAG TPA: tetratricopeptide repeat protein, partial [Polyangia bacterium]|nr:tetratricopeptide repeat protein [Polyangia bacterium]